MAVGNLKNFRRDWPGIVVIKAMYQGGKGLDVSGQAGEEKHRLAVRNRTKAVRPEQIRIAVGDLWQKQNRRKGGVRVFGSESGDYSARISNHFRPDSSQKATCMNEGPFRPSSSI